MDGIQQIKLFISVSLPLMLMLCISQPVSKETTSTPIVKQTINSNIVESDRLDAEKISSNSDSIKQFEAIKTVALKTRLGDCAYRQRLSKCPDSIRVENEVNKIAKITIREANKHSIDPLFAAAIFAKESRFDPKATSPDGARNVAQMTPIAVKMVCKNNHECKNASSNMVTNIVLGIRLIAHLDIKHQGNKRLVLSEYNGGPSQAKRLTSAETKNYIAQVMSLYRSLKF